MKRTACLAGAFVAFAAILASAAGAPSFPLEAGNPALRLTVRSLRATPVFGASPAPAGRQWLVLRAVWENRIDAKLAAERSLPTMIENGDLKRHLYLVVDGSSLGTLATGLANTAGEECLGSLALNKPGAKVEGDLVFDIPAGAFTSADLRYFEDIAGHFSLPLAGPAPAPKPVTTPVRIAAGEFGIYAVDDPAKGETPPPGFRAIALDLRGRSTWTTDGDAPHYNAALPMGTQVKQLMLLDWPDTHATFRLLADGEYAFNPRGGTLPESARFIPGCDTGGTLLFFVPADAQSLELTCTLTGSAAGDSAPTGELLRLSVAGPPPVLSPVKLPLQIKDEMFQVGVAARACTEFAGQTAGPDRSFLVLDVIVENAGGGPECFQPRAQLQLAAAGGGDLECDALTERGPRRPEETVFVPGGARRRFELVFSIPSAPPAPLLRFRGGSFQEDFPLPLKP